MALQVLVCSDIYTAWVHGTTETPDIFLKDFFYLYVTECKNFVGGHSQKLFFFADENLILFGLDRLYKCQNHSLVINDRHLNTIEQIPR